MGSAMRVLMVSTYPPQRCGIAEYTRALVRELSGRYGVSVVVFAEKRSWTRTLVALDGRALVVRGWSRRGRIDLLRALRLLASFKPDIIHIQHEYGLFKSRLAFTLGLLFLKLLGFKIVVTLHTVCDVLQMAKRGISPTWDKIISRLADAAIVHTIRSAKLLRAYGWDKNRCTVIRHGASEIDGITDLSGREKVDVLFIGFITPRKGVDLVIDALSRLRDDGVDNWTFTVAGFPHPASLERDLPYLRRVLRKIAESRLGEKVRLIIEYLSYEKMEKLLKEADIVVLPYRELHGASGILRLVAAHGKAVVVSDVGEFSEEIRDMVNGLVFKPGDIEELADKLKLAILDDSLRNKLGQELYRTIAARNTWRNVAKLTVEVYERVLYGH
ncbi:MAG: hypothetical protein DRN99_03320 [Thermoproteota archaeon]|nr:MAG: hypothetical protein DRN99_03320 [Candidatus Korarchaeota archaeon]